MPPERPTAPLTRSLDDAPPPWQAGVGTQVGSPGHAGSATAVALVEGPSDAAAVQALARRLGRDLKGEGMMVLALGGATNIGSHLGRLCDAGVRVSGLCDADEERSYRRAIEQVGLCARATREQMERLGFFVCEADLEDELIRALGTEAALEVLRRAGHLEKFSRYQHQPAHRDKPVGAQLRGFVTNWKIDYARRFVDGLELDRIPAPLARLLSWH